MTKKRIALLAAMVCCAALLAAGTTAYFTAEEKAFNVITTGRLKMALYDEAADGAPFPSTGISGVMPGESVDKKVYVENMGDCDIYVRIGLAKIIAPGNLSLEKISLNINAAHWTEKDNWYYYNTVLVPGGKTEPLFTQVSFDKQMPNAYMNARVEVNVDAQAVQSKNNTGSALTASGWPS